MFLSARLFESVWIDFVAAVFSCLCVAAVVAASSRGRLLELQQLSYGIDSLIKRMRSKKRTFGFYSAASVASCLFAVVSFFGNKIIVGAEFFASLVFVGVFIPYLRRLFSAKEKKPLVVTPRIKRLYATIFLFSLFITILFRLLVYLAGVLTCSAFFSLSFLTVFLPFFGDYIVVIAANINSPFENERNESFVRRAGERLASLDGLIKIGITGSYGKTSVKEILAVMLEERYRTLATPASYNTPLGIAVTAQKLDETYDVFIAELGARRKGDIRKLCEIVKPTHCVLNGITTQHLETFGSIENVFEEKTELLRSLRGGVAVVSNESEWTAKVDESSIPCGVKLLKCGIEKNNSSVYARDLLLSEHGAEFTIVWNGKGIRVRSPLLGAHNVTNVLLASALCLEMGLSEGEVARGVSRLKQISHRLEVTRANGVTVIDDGYNANERGAAEAIKVLSLFKGRKILVTPGLVELGERFEGANYEFAKNAGSKIDVAVLVSSKGVPFLKRGLLDGGLEKESLFVASSLEQAKKILKGLTKIGDVILFENDLPDVYS